MIATLVSHPSLPGTENFWSSALDAGPDAATPATVSSSHATTTMRLWASTQRVSDDKSYLLVCVGVIRPVHRTARRSLECMTLVWAAEQGSANADARRVAVRLPVPHRRVRTERITT